MISNAFSEDYFDIDEQNLFCSILYHDDRGGNKIRMTLSADKSLPGKARTNHFANKNYNKIFSNDMSSDVYTSLNTFKSYRRNSDDLFAYNCIYLDLDRHDMTGEALQNCLSKTEKFLSECFENGTLVRPTMITSTGRGFGIFYVLDRSIANVEKAQKSIKYLNAVRSRLTNQYAKVLQSVPGLAEVDRTVSDPARVVRMPGTVNQKNRQWCHLADVNKDEEGTPVYFGLKALSDAYGLSKQHDTYVAQKEAKKIVFLAEYKLPFLTLRIEKLELLQKLRKSGREEGYREYACFIFYNAAKQIYGAETAREMLKEFNDNFASPLSLAELEGAMRSADKNKSIISEAPYEGFYKLTDAWIIEKLGITKEENEVCRFGLSKRQIERANIKEEHKNARTERNLNIAQYILKHPELTYLEIAEEFKVSESTVRRAAKANSVSRYKKVIKKAIAPIFENVQNLAESLLGVPSAAEGDDLEVRKKSLLGRYMQLYGEVSRRFRSQRPIPGQLSLLFGDDGSISYG